MDYFTYKIGRKRTGAVKGKQVTLGKGNESAEVAKAVLVFLSFGLTNGAESLSQNYKPSSKVKEFVTVSGEILSSLRREYENNFANDAVVMSMKVNNKQKRIELTQLGRDVMLTLDNSATIIDNTTLAQLYANMRNDMIKHAEIYGRGGCPEFCVNGV